jgi:hypothetical protein
MLGAMGRKRLPVFLATSAALLGIALLAAGCGSDSKPDYCSNVSDLQDSVDELGDVKLESGVLGTVEADLKKIQADANAVVSSAKQDFPSETSALKSSVSELSATANQLPPAPTPQQLLGLGAGIQSTVMAAQELSSATESACE